MTQYSRPIEFGTIISQLYNGVSVNPYQGNGEILVGAVIYRVLLTRKVPVIQHARRIAKLPNFNQHVLI